MRLTAQNLCVAENVFVKTMKFRLAKFYIVSERGFSGDYREYYGLQMDVESIAYLMLANDILKQFYPNIITIAEVKLRF